MSDILDPDQIVIFGGDTLRVSEAMALRLRESSRAAEIIGRGVDIVVLPHDELIALHERVPVMSVRNEMAEFHARIDAWLEQPLVKILGPTKPAPTYTAPPHRTGARERARRARQEAKRAAKAETKPDVALLLPAHCGAVS